MRSEPPLGGGLLWALIGFVAAGLLLAGYFWVAAPTMPLNDQELDARARQGEVR